MEYYNEYLIQDEPNKCDRVRNWMAAIGLQDVDGLTPSNYMLEAVRRNIEGEITIDEVERLVDEYYTTQEGLKQESRTLEADKVLAEVGKELRNSTRHYHGKCSTHRYESKCARACYLALALAFHAYSSTQQRTYHELAQGIDGRHFDRCHGLVELFDDRQHDR